MNGALGISRIRVPAINPITPYILEILFSPWGFDRMDAKSKSGLLVCQ